MAGAGPTSQVPHRRDRGDRGDRNARRNNGTGGGGQRRCHGEIAVFLAGVADSTGITSVIFVGVTAIVVATVIVNVFFARHRFFTFCEGGKSVQYRPALRLLFGPFPATPTRVHIVSESHTWLLVAHRRFGRAHAVSAALTEAARCACRFGRRTAGASGGRGGHTQGECGE